PVVFPFAPMLMPLKTVPSARASTALTITNGPPQGGGGFSCRRSSVCLALMHKAGGVLVQRPPALRGLNPQLDVTDSPLILRFQGSPCPCELARKTLNGERCRGCGISCKSLSGKKKISHLIPPRGLLGQPHGGGDGAPGKDCPVSCYMPHGQLLA